MSQSQMIDDEIWMAPLISEEWPAGISTKTRLPGLTGPPGSAARLQDSEYIPQNGAGWFSLSVRGDKLNDRIRNQSCVLKHDNESLDLRGHQYTWTNLGLRSKTNPNNGNQACGATLSPNPEDVDLTTSDFSSLLPERLCNRFGRIYEIFKKSYCPIPCVQDGNVDFGKIPKGTFGQTCMCNITILANESQYNDAYMARAIGKALFDDRSFERVKKYVRDKGLDLDARRPNQPTRRRGLEKKWIDGKPGNETFQDAYNNYIDFKMKDPTQHVRPLLLDLLTDILVTQLVNELGQVEDFDTLYYTELNVRMLGILLADKAFTLCERSHALVLPLSLVSCFSVSDMRLDPFTCAALYDPLGPNATAPLLYLSRDP
eukprot:766428-Hanusia_phi.AAC.8